MKLFTVTSKMPSKTYGELKISWYVGHRDDQWDPKPLATAAPESRAYEGQCHQIAEAFTEEEAKQLADYLKRVHNDESEIKEFVPFIPDDPTSGVMPLSAIGIGGGDREVWLSEEKEYDLPFRACGHYYLFQNLDDNGDLVDPDYDVNIDEDGFVSTAGGDPIGVADPIDEKDPIKAGLTVKSILDSLIKKDMKMPDKEGE